MKSRTISVLLIFVFTVFSSGGTVLAESVGVGTISYVEGRVDVTRSDLDKAARVNEEDVVMLGDIIRTKTSARVKITFNDDTVLYLAPNSRVGVEEYLFGDDGKRQSASIKLFRGKIRSVVAKHGKEENFHIVTPSAKGTVKGTDVFAIHQADMTSILVKDGAMSVRSHDFPDKVVTLKKGASLSVPVREELGAERPFLDPELKMHLKDTEPAFTSGPKLEGKGVVVMKAKITSLSGDVKIIRTGKNKPNKAESGNVLYQGDRVETGDNSKVEFTLENGNIVTMQPNSEILLKSVKYDPRTKEYENLFESKYGKIKAIIEKVGKNSSFRIKTPTAVCGARGTIMYVNIDSSSTTAFFEGGQGDITNLVSGDSAVIDAGQNSSSDATGVITAPVDTGSHQIMGMDQAFDGPASMEGYSKPEGMMSHAGGEGGGMGMMGLMDGIGGDMDPGMIEEGDMGMPDAETMDAIYEAASKYYEDIGVTLTTESTDFEGSFGVINEVDGKEDFVGTITSTNFVKGQFTFDIPINSSGVWATNDAGYSVRTSISANNNISGTYAKPAGSPGFWNSEIVRYVASDGGVVVGAVNGGMQQTAMGGKFLGFYVDPTGTGGTMSAIFMATVDETTFEKAGIMPVFYSKRGPVAIAPGDLDMSTFQMDPIVGNAYGSFSGGTAGSLTGAAGGESIHITDTDWGIWWVQSGGTYTEAEVSNSWKIVLDGTNTNSIDSSVSSWIGTARGITGNPDRPAMSWENGMILGQMNGFWLKDNGDGSASVGYVSNGDFCGDYANGNWQAGGGGEWAEITNQLTQGGAGAGVMGFTVAEFDGLVSLGNMSEAAYINNIAGANAAMPVAAMTANFYDHASFDMWGGYIVGRHNTVVPPANGWSLGLTNAGGDVVNLSNGTWVNNEWTADVAGTVDTPVIDFVGQAGGTYQDNGEFQGVAIGTWTLQG